MLNRISQKLFCATIRKKQIPCKSFIAGDLL